MSCPEQRVRSSACALTDHALKTMSRRFAGLYAKTGRRRRAIVAGPVAAGAVHDPERSAAGGRAQLQPAVPLVRRLEYGRPGLASHAFTRDRRGRLMMLKHTVDMACQPEELPMPGRPADADPGNPSTASDPEMLRKAKPYLRAGMGSSPTSVRPTRRGPPNARRRHCCWRPARRRAARSELRCGELRPDDVTPHVALVRDGLRVITERGNENSWNRSLGGPSVVCASSGIAASHS